ncbi:MAG: hypothetical protein ACJATT_004297 [Myxococcota bacterium]|jgi:hypothetical protein
MAWPERTGSGRLHVFDSVRGTDATTNTLQQCQQAGKMVTLQRCPNRAAPSDDIQSANTIGPLCRSPSRGRSLEQFRIRSTTPGADFDG